MRVSTAGLPFVEAASTEQLGLRLASNALMTPFRTESSDKAARAICHAIIDGVGKLDSSESPGFIFKEDFYTQNEAGRQILNGAADYRQALLEVLGGRQTTNRNLIHERTIMHPETRLPFRRWEWYGAGLLRVAGDEILVLEGKTQRWRTSPREGWLDFFRFGAMARVTRTNPTSRPMRRLDLRVYDTLDALPIDIVRTGNIDETINY